MRGDRYMTISAVAARIGVHPQTLRRWECEGLIPPATRRFGRRVYTDADVEQIEQSIFKRFDRGERSMHGGS